MKALASNALAAVLTLAAAPTGAQERDLDLAAIDLPAGFRIGVFARVPDARALVSVPALDTVFVSNRRGDGVYAAVDADRDGRTERVARVASGLKSPNGIAWKDGHLYVAEQHRVIRIPVPDLESLGTQPPEVVFEGLPDKRWHGWRYAAFDPQGRLHVAVGAPCNICAPDGLEGTIVRLDGGEATVVARGIRNSVGIDFHPETGDMFFTDNGADNMGDDVPPDELNRLTETGQHFGFPIFGGGAARTVEFGGAMPPRDLTQPVARFDAHVAALGVDFYRGDQFPDAYRTDAFVAQHGSWNRSVPIGYRVMRVRMGPDGTVEGTEVFASGWLRDSGEAWGRPVDVEELPDGSLLVSDDASGTVYRISYGG